jgi:SAM-dependent methyltransferase
VSARECPACGGALREWRAVPPGEPSDPRRYPLLRCESCGSAVTAGDPPGPELYERGIYAPGPPRAGPVVRAVQGATVGQPGRLLRRAGLAPGASVLDAGAGRGRLVAELARRGYDARGIEPSERGAASAAAAGLPVARESLERHSDAGLDAVVLWHVLEHLDEPGAALARVRSWLRPGGLVLVGVPNAESLQARIAGEGWLHWDVPRHRVHLSPSGLESLLRRSGFEPARTSHMVWEHNPAGLWMGLLTRAGMTPGFPFHLLKRNVRVRPRDLALTALGLPLLPLAALLEAGAAAARRGGTVAVVARSARNSERAPARRGRAARE